MNKEFVPYDLALELKELGYRGFNDTCFGAYKTAATRPFYGGEGDLIVEINANRYAYTLFAPTYSQAFRWFRDTLDLSQYIESFGDGTYDYTVSMTQLLSEAFNIPEGENLDGPFPSYEECEQACLKEMINMVKKYNLLTVDSQ